MDEKLKEFHKKLKKNLENQEKYYESFIYSKEAGFYQGFDKIELKGCRSSEKRLERYDIKEFLSDSKKALDIGCNCGFFTLLISDLVSKIDGVEINPFLIQIARDTKDFLKNHNSSFYTTSFEKFRPKEKYDIIFSLANDETVDGNTKFTFIEYILKIRNLLNPEGLLIFESQALKESLNEFPEKKYEHLKKHFDILVEKKVPTDYPYNVKERAFFVLKKK
ncbi:class I SAM-dependent methyltransferase [Candidatus Pacearchaeota archaeon]|nr:class I SAM-dependent methyltransferase [Candidatus Pacearchaeota archaeon]